MQGEEQTKGANKFSSSKYVNLMKNFVHQHYNESNNITSKSNYNDYVDYDSPANKATASKLSFKEAVLTKKPPPPPPPQVPVVAAPVNDKKVERKETATEGVLDSGVTAKTKRKSNRRRRGRGKNNAAKSAGDTEDEDEEDDGFDLSKENFPGLHTPKTVKDEQSDEYSSGIKNRS
jgi:type IV secretory pathway VirB10-like protein